MPKTMTGPAQQHPVSMVDPGRSGMRRALAALSADARMLSAISADFAHSVNPRQLAHRPAAADPFELRDPEYIARTLPALRVMADVWFRADVRGLENIPPRGPVLLVGNHSGGTLIADTFVFAQAFYDHFGPERPFFQLAHDLVFKMPGIRAMLTPYGTVPASPENMSRALARGAALLVYPGGDHETYRASWHSAEIDFAHRTGFVRLALNMACKSSRSFRSAVRRRRCSSARASTSRDCCICTGYCGSTWRRSRSRRRGASRCSTCLDAFPCRRRSRSRCCPPIDLRRELGGARGDPDEGYDLVTGRMQDALRTLDEARGLPLIG